MLGLDRDGGQFHVGLRGRSAAFLDVALQAAANDVGPRGLAVLRSGYNVVQAKLSRVELLAAVLASVAIAGVDVAPVELDGLARHAVVRQHPDDARNRDVEAYRANPVMFRRFELLTESTQLSPVVEIVRNVLPFFDVDDFRDLFVAMILLE